MKFFQGLKKSAPAGVTKPPPIPAPTGDSGYPDPDVPAPDPGPEPAGGSGEAVPEGQKEESYVIDTTEEERTLLCRLIQAEAEAEPLLGKVAVGAVLVNRVRHPDFPSTITGVILQQGQFESVANGRLASIGEPNQECREAAHQALLGTDPSNGALFFYNPQKSKSQWLKEKRVTATLGSHLFSC